MSKYIKLTPWQIESLQKQLTEKILFNRRVIIMTEKTVGKPRSRSRTLWFSGGLMGSGVALAIAFLTSPAFNLFVETNVPNVWMAFVVAAIGVVVNRLREVTTEPIAK